MSKEKLTKRDQQWIETRKRVFEAAVAEFTRVGVANAQVEAITSQAGVSVGTYYRYFPNKDDILFELLQSYMADLATQLVETLSHSEYSLEELLKACVDPIFEIIQNDELPLIRELFALIMRQPPQDFDWISVPLLNPVLQRFEEEYKQGRSKYADPARPTRLFFTALLGFISIMHPCRNRQECHEFISIFLRGLDAREENIPAATSSTE